MRILLRVRVNGYKFIDSVLKVMFNSIEKCAQLEDKELQMERLMSTHELILKEKERLENDLNGLFIFFCQESMACRALHS